MPGQRSSFGKLQRDRAKKAKASAKRERREERATPTTEADDSPAQVGHSGEVSTDQLLAEIELVHQQFEAGEIGYQDFEEKKAALLARLTID